jgi:hypothetical protein
MLARTILCVGIGFSTEARALAVHGLEVSALDISDVPRAWFRSTYLDTSRPEPVWLTVKGDDKEAAAAPGRPSALKQPRCSRFIETSRSKDDLLIPAGNPLEALHQAIQREAQSAS